MKKLVAGLVVSGLLMHAAPARAAVVYTPLGPWLDNAVGIIGPGGGLYSAYWTSGSGLVTSDVITVTFGLHLGQPYISVYLPYNVAGLHFNFMYDNSSLEVVSARPVGPIGPGGQGFNYGLPGQDNYVDPPVTWPNPSSGLTGLDSLFQGWGVYITDPSGDIFTPTDYIKLVNSTVIPFFQVTLHVKKAVPSHVNNFGISELTMFLAQHLVSSDVTITRVITPSEWVYGTGRVHEVPEPASPMLLGGALAFAAGRMTRYRRRMA